ncbi:MAG: arylesterase [Alphaproteobacteria bacterium]
MGRAYGSLRHVFNLLALMLLVTLLWQTAAGAAASTQPRLLLLGDSIFAGYGLPADQGFAARLGAALDGRGLDVAIVDGGVSGDTTAGGLARLDWLLADEPTHAVVALGGNDALRGLPPEDAFHNLDGIVTRLREAGVAVMLAGMYAPPNLGAEYGEAFAAIYVRLAEKHEVALYPFVLDGVARDPALNQPDGIHPNAAGVAILVERILPPIEALLRGAPG